MSARGMKTLRSNLANRRVMCARTLASSLGLVSLSPFLFIIAAIISRHVTLPHSKAYFCELCDSSSRLLISLFSYISFHPFAHFLIRRGVTCVCHGAVGAIITLLSFCVPFVESYTRVFLGEDSL